MIIKWLGHASFKISSEGKVIYVDPYAGEYDEAADIILITHGHYDHFNAEKINSIMNDSTVVIGTEEVASQMNGVFGLSNGTSKTVDSIKVHAVPAYNIGKSFHPKGINNGYILELEGKKVYIAGDTDLIPEMSRIKADIVLVPVGGTYTMNANEAAEAVLKIKPKIAIPMHFGSIVGTEDDAVMFKEEIEGKSDVKVMILGAGEETEV